MNLLTPANESELMEICRDGSPFRVVGENSAQGWLPEYSGQHVSTKQLNQICEFRPDDLVMKVQAGTSLAEIHHEAAKASLTVPIPPPENGWLGYKGKTIGGLFALGLPHYWQNQTGPVKDWILAAKTISPTGQSLEFGANVVKSVAGFDVHKSLVGSRGGMLIFTEITLRLYPIKLLPPPIESTIASIPWINRGRKSVLQNLASDYLVDNSGRMVWADRALADCIAIGPNGQHLPKPQPQIQMIQSRYKQHCDPNNVLIEGWAK